MKRDVIKALLVAGRTDLANQLAQAAVPHDAVSFLMHAVGSAEGVADSLKRMKQRLGRNTLPPKFEQQLKQASAAADKLTKLLDALLTAANKDMLEQRGMMAASTTAAGPFGPMAQKGNVSVHLPGEMTRLAGEVYNKATTMKLEMDAMEEVPNYLKSIYKMTMRVQDEAGKLKQTAYNLQMNMRKAMRSV